MDYLRFENIVMKDMSLRVMMRLNLQVKSMMVRLSRSKPSPEVVSKKLQLIFRLNCRFISRHCKFAKGIFFLQNNRKCCNLYETEDNPIKWSFDWETIWFVLFLCHFVMWSLKLVFRPNILPHKLQLYFMRFLWTTLMWSFKYLFIVYVFGHCGQAKSWEWLFMCSFRLLAEGHAFLHSSQAWSLSSISFSFSSIFWHLSMCFLK